MSLAIVTGSSGLVGIDTLFNGLGRKVSLVVHAAAQPSHEWAVKELFTDFTVNANGSLVLLEAIRMIEELCGRRLHSTLSEKARVGDHVWYISDVRKFQNDYPDWGFEYDLERIIAQLVAAAKARG